MGHIYEGLGGPSSPHQAPVNSCPLWLIPRRLVVAPSPGGILPSAGHARSPLPLQALGVKSCYRLALSPSPAIMGASSYLSSFHILQAGSRGWSLLSWAPSLLGPDQALPGIAGHLWGWGDGGVVRKRLISSDHTSDDSCQPPLLACSHCTGNNSPPENPDLAGGREGAGWGG